jgi:uncharacterized DUF497 family protein
MKGRPHEGKEAATVFADPLAIPICDADHSVGEARYILIARSLLCRLLVATRLERGVRARLISAVWRRCAGVESMNSQVSANPGSVWLTPGGHSRPTGADDERAAADRRPHRRATGAKAQ